MKLSYSHTLLLNRKWNIPNLGHTSACFREHNNRHPNMEQDQETMHPCLRPQKSCVLQKSKNMGQRPNLTTGSFNSIIPSTPSIRANRINDNKFNNILGQNTQTLESKLKKLFLRTIF
jgi:cytoskeleton-associated protein 2